MARGSTVRATFDFLRQTYGQAMLDAILATMDRDASQLLSAARTTDFLPYDQVRALWRSADARLRGAHPLWMEEAGAFAIASLGQRLYGGLLRKSTPEEFLTQSTFVYQLYYSQGELQPVEIEPGRAVLRLVGFSGDSLFCRRQTGGIASAIRIAGGNQVRVDHVRCTAEGDAYCEWEMLWR